MPRYVEYNPTLEAIWVDWDNTDNPENKLYLEFQKFLKQLFNGNNKSNIWELNDNQLIPRSGPWGPEDTVEELKPIIKFMNDNKIEWSGQRVTFRYEYDIGFICIREEDAILGYIDEDGEVNKEYIPLIENKKII